MRHVSFILGGLAAGSVAVGVALHFRGPSSPPCSTASLVRPADSGQTSDEPNEEVRRLRAEVRKRDEMLAALLARAGTSSSGGAQGAQGAPPAPVADPTDPGDRAVDILDERMFTTPSDPSKAAEMERAIREVAGSPALSPAKISSLQCGSRLCKVMLTAASGGDLNQSMADLGSHLPKLFGASAVHRSSDGQSAMYLARSSEDLALTGN